MRLLTARADEIVAKWMLHKPIKPSESPGAEMIPSIINIVAVEPVATYCLRLQFDDGTEQRVDFEPFLSHAQHPDIRKFLEPAQFNGYRLEYGELVWGDYELCFPIGDLYRNDLDTNRLCGRGLSELAIAFSRPHLSIDTG